MICTIHLLSYSLFTATFQDTLRSYGTVDITGIYMFYIYVMHNKHTHIRTYMNIYVIVFLHFLDHRVISYFQFSTATKDMVKPTPYTHTHYELFENNP
jgi:hypothetical protein